MSQFDEVINRRGTNSKKYDRLLVQYGDADLLPMWVADMDFKAPQAVIDALVKRAAHGIYGYPLEGAFHREAVVKWHEKRNGITYEPTTIFYTPTVVNSINLAILAFTEEQDSVMMSIPAYGPFVTIPENAKRQCVTNQLKVIEGEYVFDFPSFEAAIIKHQVKLYILCHPHNPTGRVWTAEELETLLRICQKHHVMVLSDEIHSDLIMPGQSFVPTMSVARKIGYSDRVMVLSSPTKTFNLAGLQVSYYILEDLELQKKLSAVRDYILSTDRLNGFSFVGLEAAYEHGDSYVDELTTYVYQNYLYLKAELSKHCPLVTVSDLQATYLPWIQVDKLGITEEALKAATQAHGLAIQTSGDFFQTEPLAIRINLACPRTIAEKGIDLLIKSLLSFSVD